MTKGRTSSTMIRPSSFVIPSFAILHSSFRHSSFRHSSFRHSPSRPSSFRPSSFVIRPPLLPSFLLLLLLLLLPLLADSATFSTQSEALDRAFPGAQVERIGHVLTEVQMAEAADLAGAKLPSALVAAYEARRDGQLVGTAYFDAHRVHSQQETLMIVVGPDGRVADVQVLAFAEPPKYLAPPAWMKQFPGRALDDRLRLKQDIQGITGATLTARATTKAVRRILAIHAILGGSRITEHGSRNP